VAASESSRQDAAYDPPSLYSEAINIVHHDYVSVPWSKLVSDGVAGMVESLDGDSALLGPALSRALASAAPRDSDVGIAVGRRGPGLVVIVVRDGSPARMAGVRSGDLLVSIDGAATTHVPPMEAEARLRGVPGTERAITVVRTGWAGPKVLRLRGEAPSTDRVSDRALGDGILYIRIPELRMTTAHELEQVLDRPAAAAASGFVLDLRNTARGQVEAAASVAGQFLDPRSVVAHVESRAATPPPDVLAPTSAEHRSQPVAALLNHGTESAAEVLAGTLQDWGRAVIVGSATFGDASAQSLISLPEERTLELTTARYLTPKERIAPSKMLPSEDRRAIGDVAFRRHGESHRECARQAGVCPGDLPPLSRCPAPGEADDLE
jgi:carboxyl-terminal processing protease